MTDTTQLLLAHHLKALKLPTFLREYDKLARQCAAEGLDHIRFLLRLAELELIDRERRMVERRIKRRGKNSDHVRNGTVVVQKFLCFLGVSNFEYGQADLRRHSRPATTASRLPAPIRPKTRAMPADNGVRLNDRQRIANSRE